MRLPEIRVRISLILIATSLAAISLGCKISTAGTTTAFIPGSTVTPSSGVMGGIFEIPPTVTPSITPTVIPTLMLLPEIPPDFSILESERLQDGDWVSLDFTNQACTPVKIYIHPLDDQTWFVVGDMKGENLKDCLLTTRDGGINWELSFTGEMIYDFQIDPLRPNSVYVSSSQTLYVSDDLGRHWREVFTIPSGTIVSFVISAINKSIFIAPGWQGATETGIYVSFDQGARFNLKRIPATSDFYIPWDLVQDPNNGFVYVMYEIGDHPQPYMPKFFRSKDRGSSWEDISAIHWHATRLVVDPSTSELYVLTEGAGLWLSADKGQSFSRLSDFFLADFMIDKTNNNRMYGSDSTFGGRNGGVFLSEDGGIHFTQVGLVDKEVWSLAINSDGTRLFVVWMNHAIYYTDHLIYE